MRHLKQILLKGSDYPAVFARTDVSSISVVVWLEEGPLRENKIVFYAFYAVAIVILVLHFSGWLKRSTLEWMILVPAGAVFPAVIFLK